MNSISKLEEALRQVTESQSIALDLLRSGEYEQATAELLNGIGIAEKALYSEDMVRVCQQCGSGHVEVLFDYTLKSGKVLICSECNYEIEWGGN